MHDYSDVVIAHERVDLPHEDFDELEVKVSYLHSEVSSWELDA